MTCLLGCAWHGGAELAVAVAKLPAGGPEVLALLAVNLLVFRTFRHRYFLWWILGWLTFVIYRTPGILVSLGGGAALEPLSEATFILSVFLFSAAVLAYTNAPRLLPPSAMLTGLAMVTVVMRWVWWPASPFLRFTTELVLPITVAASLQLVRRAWSRWHPGPWLLAAMLVFLGLGSKMGTSYSIPGFETIYDLALGISMLLIVFDESQARTRRLALVSILANASAQARDHDAMLKVMLDELKQFMHAKAAWFCSLEGKSIVTIRHKEFSPEFLRVQQSLGLDITVARVLNQRTPAVVRAKELDPTTRGHMLREGLNHVVILPVRDKDSVIGTVTLASRHRRYYSPQELELLGATANRLGIALENLRFFEQIRRSQREWISTFDSIEDLVLVHDSDFHIKQANRALLSRLGLEPAQIINNTCESVLPHAQQNWEGCPYCSRAGIAEAADPCFGGSSLVSTSSYVWKESYGDQGTKTLGTIHVIRDTTQRRAAEEKYRQLFEQVQEGVFVSDATGRLLDCNHALVSMLGYGSREELLALHADVLYASPDLRQRVVEQIKKQNYVRSFEVLLSKRDGTKLSALETSFASRTAEGEIESYQGFLQDITEKKQAEDELRRRNRELHALNAIAVIATQSFDLDEILNLTLRQVIKLFSAETGSVYLTDDGSGILRRRAAWGHRGKTVLTHGELNVPQEFWKSIAHSKTEVITAADLPRLPPSIIEIVNAEGLLSWIWVILWSKDRPMGMLGVNCRGAREFTASDQKLLVAVGSQLANTVDKIRLYEETSRAYDDLRRTQEQLLQSEKMSAVGQLISGVAHELNNPLTAILGYAQLLENEALNDRSRDFVGKLFKQAQRTHRLVQNLLSFARQRKPQKARVDIRRVLEDTLVLREYDLKRYKISVERKFEADLTVVTADSHQLEQVFLNIINNAVDAMLEVSQSGVLQVRVYLQGGKVCAEFQDSGPGFADPKRIFDPFYTTKAVGKGTGLGLSICYGIVKEHGGEIEAHNASSGGALVKVSLPAAGQAAPAYVPTPAQSHDLALQGRVLVVEDEEAVLEFEREVLVGAGAQVVTASSAEQAISQLKTKKFDAIILNGALPNGWDARRIYKVFAQAAPGMQNHLLLTVTNLIDAETQAFLRENNVAYLVKPFEISDLIRATRRLLLMVYAASTT